MKDAHLIAPYSLRMETQLRDRASAEAESNRRSLNSELRALIEDGFKWRDMQAKRVNG
jgi:hypothetical protein